MCKKGILILCVLALCLSTMQLVNAAQKPNRRPTREQYIIEEETEAVESTENNDARHEENKIGYIIVGESHVTLSEAAVMSHNNIQNCAAGNLVLGQDLFFIHTIRMHGTEIMHNGSSNAYENLGTYSQVVNFIGADPKWLHMDGIKLIGVDDVISEEPLSALTRIKTIVDKHEDKDSWVIVIVQGFTIAGTCSIFNNYSEILRDKVVFADKLTKFITEKRKQVKVFDMSAPYGDVKNNGETAKLIQKLNKESISYFADKDYITFCNWSDDWVDWELETTGSNHLSQDSYYKLWQEHLGKELSISKAQTEITVNPSTPVVEEILTQSNSSPIKTSETLVEIQGLSKSYKIAWVSDLHVVANNGSNLSEIKSSYNGKSPSEYVKERYDMFVTDKDNSLHSVDIWDDIIRYLNSNGFDAVIFGGDLMDYYSDANYNKVKEGLSQLNIPWMFIYGSSNDHDTWTGLTGGSNVVEKVKGLNNLKNGHSDRIDLGEIAIVGIQNSADASIKTEIIRAEENINSVNKPIILATHVPFASSIPEVESNLKATIQKVQHDRIYYWAKDSHKWKINENNEVEDFLNKYIYSNNTNIVCVAAGHVHLVDWDGQLSYKVKQHIFPASYRGYVGVLNITP